MGHIEYKKTLTATPAAVWGIVADPGTWGDWFSIHERWMQEPPATLTVGATLVDKIFMLGMANKLEWVVTALDEPHTLTLGGTGMAGVKVEFTFTVTATDSGSELAVAGDFEGALIKGALGKAVEKDGLTQLERSLTALDELATK